MRIHDLRDHQANFEKRIDSFIDKYENLHKLRKRFVRYFNKKQIASMTSDDYCVGCRGSEKNFNFCNGLERQLDGLGRITGATAFKFGVYCGRTSSDSKKRLRYAKKYGTTYDAAFKKIKEEILAVLEYGENSDDERLATNILSPMFKGKILSIYFPEKYLNIFSEEHVNHFLMSLNLDYKGTMREDVIIKRRKLLQFKNDDDLMKTWSNDIFCEFLYSEFPPDNGKRNNNSKTDKYLLEYRRPKFPLEQEGEYVDFFIVQLDNKSKISTDRRMLGKPDYESESRNNAIIGARGEKIVYEMEVKRLNDLGHVNLAAKVKKVSTESDSYGYDILSYESDGAERLIEVKASLYKSECASFYLTRNELDVANRNKNYFIYFVYDLENKRPKVWRIKNPFNPNNKLVDIQPIKYRVKMQKGS